MLPIMAHGKGGEMSLDLFEAFELSKIYKPAAVYTISKITEKGNAPNQLHDEMVNQLAYPLFLKEGERGWLMCKPEYTDRFHRIHTSQIVSFTPWENGEDTVIIETQNTIYTLSK